MMLTFLLTLAGYRVAIQLANTGPPGSRRELIAKILGAGGPGVRS